MTVYVARCRTLLSAVASVLLVIVAFAIGAQESPTAFAQGAGPSGNTRWAVILCKFSDAPAEPRPASFFREMFTETGAGKGGMFDYWHDVSMGAVDLTGSQVFDWKSMPLSLQKAREDKTSRWDLTQTCINTQDPFVGYPGFYGIIAIVNEMYDAGSTGQVSLWLDGSQHTYGILNLDPGALFDMFAAHEMGHGYGLRHSYKANVPDPCSLWGGPGEYCDTWDIMSAMNGYTFDNPTFCNTGSPADCRSGPGLSAAYRDQLGWIPSNRKVDISSVPGGTRTVTLSGLESGLPGTLLATITGTNGRRYAVEFRTRDRWDKSIPRETVQVREIVGKKAYLQQAKSGLYEFLPGDYMADYGDKVAVSVLGIDSAQHTATVRIGPTPPATVISSATLSPAANAVGWSRGNATVTLHTVASSVGVQSLTFSAYGADPLPATTRSGSTTSVTLTREGTTTLVYAGLDNAGNAEFPRTLEIKIDKTVPHTKTKVVGDWNGTQYIELEADDQASPSGVKNIQYEAYGANPIPPTTISSTLARLSISAPGETSFFYWATDTADNIDGPYHLTFKPQPQFSPTTLQLSTPLGSTVKQTLTLKNVGVTALPVSSITAIEASGASSSVFRVTSNPMQPCTSPLIPNGSCLIDVAFTPTTTGSFSERLVLNGAGWSTPDFVALTGSAVGVPKATLSTTTLSFGKTTVGQTSTSSILVKNDGTGTLNISSFSGGGEFQPWGGCSSIAQGQSCTIWVNFNPSSVGPKSGTLTITHNANNVPGTKSTVALDGLGVQATVSLSQASLNFGAMDVGNTSPVLATSVTNTSLYSVEVRVTDVPRIVGANAADFELVKQGCGRAAAQLAPGVSLNPGAVCEVAVVFRPQSGGARSAVLLFGFNAANPPHQVALTGSGVAPAPPASFASVNPTSVDFGLVPPGDVVSQVVSITNTGSADLGLKGVALPPAANKDGFTIDLDRCSGVTLAAGKSCDVTLVFTPPNSGARQSVLEVYDGTGNLPQEVPLSGEGK